MYNRQFNWLFLSGLLLVFLTFSCASEVNNSPEEITTATPPESATDIWSSLLQKDAYPYFTPLPPPKPTKLDGTYEKVELKEATPIPCRRCPDYMAEGGTWRLQFDRGTFRILHLPTGWQGLGSYSVDGDRLILFNDPKCPDISGIYAWSLQNGALLLDTVEDFCAAFLRGHNLENLPWQRVTGS